MADTYFTNDIVANVEISKQILLFSMSRINR